MRLKVLLVNPWIYDFAAYNLWAQPVGLRSIAKILSRYDVQIELIDCMSEYTPKKYGAGTYRAEIVQKPYLLQQIPRYYKRYGITTQRFKTLLQDFYPFDIVLMTSMMGYWYQGVQQAISIIKETTGDVPIILGGIYATLWDNHALTHSGADLIFKGSADDASLLHAFYTFGYKPNVLKTPKKIDHLFFNGIYSAIKTSDGCPFSCSFCASRLLYPSYNRISLDSVIKEIELSAKQGVRDFAFYDDALLFNPDNHIKPLLRDLANLHVKIRFHTPNGLHPKFIDYELAYLMMLNNFKTIRLSLEGIDDNTIIHSSNKVTLSEFEIAIKSLKKAAFTKDELSVYLLFGLPGQNLQSLKDSIEYVKQFDIAIKIAEFAPVRGTAIWSEMIKSGLITDDIDPLMTNNSIFSFLLGGYDYSEFNNLKNQVNNYNHLRL